MKILRIFIALCFATLPLWAQKNATGNGSLEGQVVSAGNPVPYASVSLMGTSIGTLADSAGRYKIERIPSGSWELVVSAVGYQPFTKKINIKAGEVQQHIARLTATDNKLEEVVVTGTMKEVTKLDSPVPVDVITPSFLAKNPTPSVFEGLSYVNGVRPQINCNVCNTGDIHINGLEGPYTMVLIDGVPIVSGLATVYGLTGIPNSLIERIEVVKGPASTLYGSEAVGGLINIITKKPFSAPLLSADVFSTDWGEINTDLGLRYSLSEKTQGLFGLNYFNYQNPIDKNGDGFTDLTLQNRVSVFNKFNFIRKKERTFTLAGRYVYENRWGGEMNWSSEYRGGNEIYGERDRKSVV